MASEAKTDLLVVGGGIIGCSAAAFAAERGATVLLLEATSIGAGASGRNSGAVQHPFDQVLAPLHARTLALYRALADESPGFDFPAREAGLILLAEDEADARARARELADELPELAPHFLAPADLQETEPILAADLCAVRLATGYPIPPEAATAAMAHRAAAFGAEIRTGTPAVELLAEGTRVRGVRLADGSRIEAGAVLLAAGPWTPPLAAADGAWRPLRPTHGVTVQVALPTPALSVLEEGAASTVNRPLDPDDATDEIHSTFSMVSVGETTTIGSTFLPAAPEPDALAPILRSRGARFVPSLERAPILRARVCARPQSVDGRPFIGPMPDRAGLHVCVGHGPWGISTGPASAELAIRAILEERPPALPDALRADRALPEIR